MKNEFLKRLVSTILLIPMILFIIIKGSFLFNFFILICFFITSYEWHMMSKNKPHYLLGFIFLIFSYYTVYKLIDYGGDYIYFLLILLTCVSTDIGGYVFGKIFKGPRITKISPQKTYSGMIGSFFLTIILTNIFFQLSYLLPKKIEFTFDTFIFVLLISAISQLGDIIISYFKRLSKIKNTGKILPGHGGILDRIDGMIFAFPFSYIILLTNIF